MAEQVAVVTGAASGIGRATVDRLRGLGLQVAGLDLNTTGAAEFRADVSDADSVAAAIAEVRARYGPIEVLVNAAGVSTEAVLDGDDYLATWERALAVNLTGTMLVTRACIGDLVASGHGRLVNLSSTEGISTARRLGPYSASKHGVIGFTRSIAVDYGRQGVTANIVCPGATLTGMTAQIPEADRAVYARRNVPVGRYAEPSEIAYMIATLCSSEASYVNGAVIVVDGGLTIGW